MDKASRRVLDIHESISEICGRALYTHDHSILEELCQILVERRIYSGVSVGFVDIERIKIKTVAHCGLEGLPIECEVSNMPGLQQGNYYVCNNLSSSSNSSRWLVEVAKHGYSSLAIFPIKTAKELLAALTLYSRECNTFEPEEVDAMQKLATIICNVLVYLRLDARKKHAEMELQRSEAIYSRISTKMFELLCEINGNGKLSFVSNRSNPIFGLTTEDLLGRRFLDFIHPDDTAALQNTLEAALRSRSIETGELRFQCSNGKYVWVELACDALNDPSNATSRFLIVCRDITEKKRSLERLQKYTHDLEKRVEDRTEKIRVLNETITGRLVQKIEQINNISEIRGRLEKQPGVDSNFDMIMDRAIHDLGMDAGGILIANLPERIVEVKSLRPITGSLSNRSARSNFPLDHSFVEFESLHKNQAISRIVGDEPCILETESVHCAPILFSEKVYGVLALGSKRREILDESDLSVLKLYSGLITTVLETKTLTVEPTKELVGLKEGKHSLDFGSSYLVADNVELAYELFLDSVLTGIEGLCITRTMPRKIREEYGFKRTPIVWLTDESIEEEKTIQSLQDLSILISNYVQKATKPVILIDGMEYLISHKGFDSVYHFMQAKKTQMEANQGILIVPFFKDAVEPKEARLLEREFHLFPAKGSAQLGDDELRVLKTMRPLT